MLKKDYFESHLEQLNKAILDITGLKEKEAFDMALDKAKEAIGLFRIDRDILLKSGGEELLDRLSQKFSMQEIEKLGQLLKEEGDIWLKKNDDEKATMVYEKSLELLEGLNHRDNTYSFTREACIADLQSILGADFR